MHSQSPDIVGALVRVLTLCCRQTAACSLDILVLNVNQKTWTLSVVKLLFISHSVRIPTLPYFLPWLRANH